MKTFIRKITEKGVVLNTMKEATLEKKDLGNGKVITYRRDGQSGFFAASGLKAAGLKEGDEFPVSLELTSAPVISQTTNQPLGDMKWFRVANG